MIPAREVNAETTEIGRTVLWHVHNVRRMWNHLLALIGKKWEAAVRGDGESVQRYTEQIAKVEADMTVAEAALARADYVEEHAPPEKRWRSAAWASALALMLLASPALALEPVQTTQAPVILNQTLRGTAAAVASITIASVANQRVRLYGIAASCTGGGYASLEVRDGSTIVWGTDASYISSNTKWTTFPIPLTGGLSNTMLVNMSSCAQAGSIGQLYIQADRWGP